MVTLLEIIICFFRVIVIPILVFLYVIAVVPLTIRQLSHYATYFIDVMFDITAKYVGWDTKYWPLPKASDEPLPF